MSLDALVFYNRALPDIQPVKLGTGRELYSIMLKELRGVGINMWLVPHDGVVCWGLALDHGPDNDWVVGFITSLLDNACSLGVVGSGASSTSTISL